MICWKSDVLVVTFVSCHGEIHECTSDGRFYGLLDYSLNEHVFIRWHHLMKQKL